MGVWEQIPQSPEAIGDVGVNKAPSSRMHEGLGAEPPALENF